MCYLLLIINELVLYLDSKLEFKNLGGIYEKIIAIYNNFDAFLFS